MATAPKPYVHQEFPKMLYGPQGATTVVADFKAQRALGKGWSERTPAPAPEKPAVDPGSEG